MVLFVWNLRLNAVIKQQDIYMKKADLKLRESEKNQCLLRELLLMNIIWQR